MAMYTYCKRPRDAIRLLDESKPTGVLGRRVRLSGDHDELRGTVSVTGGRGTACLAPAFIDDFESFKFGSSPDPNTNTLDPMMDIVS